MHIIGAALTSVYSPNTTAKIHFVVSCRIYVIAMDEIYIFIKQLSVYPSTTHYGSSTPHSHH